jgi:hypothetical protein
VPSARIFGLFFHLKTCGPADKSKFEDFDTIFEKTTDSARSGLEAGVQKYLLAMEFQENENVSDASLSRKKPRIVVSMHLLRG